MNLEEARRLFEQAERENNPERKYLALVEAFDITDDLIDDADGEAAGDLVRRLRQSHMRQLLRQLLAMRKVEIDIWFNYLRILLFRAKPEVEKILANDPPMRESYRIFKDLHMDELLAIVKRS